MGRSKEGRPSEFYLSQIRALKSENRNLKKRIRQLEKSEAMYDNFTDDSDEEIELPVGNENKRLPDVCQSCGKGMLIEKNIVGRIFQECNICDFRSGVIRYEK